MAFLTMTYLTNKIRASRNRRRALRFSCLFFNAGSHFTHAVELAEDVTRMGL